MGWEHGTETAASWSRRPVDAGVKSKPARRPRPKRIPPREKSRPRGPKTRYCSTKPWPRPTNAGAKFVDHERNLIRPRRIASAAAAIRWGGSGDASYSVIAIARAAPIWIVALLACGAALRLLDHKPNPTGALIGGQPEGAAPARTKSEVLLSSLC